MKPIVAALAAVALSSLVFAACKMGGPDAPSTPGGVPGNLVLRSYEVPADGAPQIRSVLKDVLWFGSDGKDSQRWVGRVDLGPDGRLVVLASEGVQAGVKGLIDSLAANPPKPQPALQLDYWLVTAVPGKGAAPGPGLTELAPALAEIEKTDGPQTFTLAEKLTVTSVSGENASVRGRDAEVRQTATATASGVLAQLQVNRFANSIDTRVKLAPGQIVVLGSSGARPKDKEEAVGSIYFMIRAATHDGQGR
jgi:hypothetical protein